MSRTRHHGNPWKPWWRGNKPHGWRRRIGLIHAPTFFKRMLNRQHRARLKAALQRNREEPATPRRRSADYDYL